MKIYTIIRVDMHSPYCARAVRSYTDKTKADVMLDILDRESMGLEDRGYIMSESELEELEQSVD